MIKKIVFFRIVAVTAYSSLSGLPVLSAAEQDPVFRRYEKKVVPSELIKLDAEQKRVVLSDPATEADVKAGKAIFTLEGLGETRVWKLPYCPIPASWTTLKQFPQESADDTPAFDNFGHVIQAEELLINGKWERYFGIVTKHGVAVAPAEEVDLWLTRLGSGILWMSLSDGLDWGVEFDPALKKLNEMRVKDPLSVSAEIEADLLVDDPLPVEGYIMNIRGVARQVPTDFYHRPDQGGPALRKGVRVVLERAPFDPKADNDYQYDDANFKSIKPKSLGVFVAEDRNKILETVESVKVLEADLHDWFDIKEEGYYRFRFEFEEQKGDRGCVQSGFTFCIGTPPPILTAEQLNRDIIPLGDKNAEDKIRILIKETCLANTNKPVEGQNIVWSEAVGGLQAAILNFSNGGYRDCEMIVGLKNVSNKPLVVPVGHPESQPSAEIFDLQIRNDVGGWKSVIDPEKLEEDVNDPFRSGTYQPEVREDKKRDESMPLSFKLSPGRMAVVYLHRNENPMIQVDSKVRIVIQQDAGKEGSLAWQGRVETPLVAAAWDDEMLKTMKGSLDFPEFLPNFDTRMFIGMNSSGNEAAVQGLWFQNRTLENALELFKENEIRKEFEQRLNRENDIPMKLMYASIAVRIGSQPAALWLLEMMKKTDYVTVRNLHSILRQLIYLYDARVPAWLLAMVEATLSDERFVTGLEKTNWASGTKFKISYLADEDENLALALGQAKCPEAVPFLIELVKKKKTRISIMALGSARDPRAIPVLLEVLKTEGKEAKFVTGSGVSPENFSRAISALANLRATEAVPALLEYSEYPEVIEALDRIGDRRAIPVLRTIVQNDGRVFRDGKELYPKEATSRMIKSKIALATLEEGDAIPRLCALLADKSFEEFDRRDVIWRLGVHPDPRSISFLIKSIKDDPEGTVVNAAIRELATFKYKAAVEGLIDCFDADFVDKSDWKRAYNPEMFRENIAKSLNEITGHTAGADKKKWLLWWETEGKSRQDLK